MKKNKEALDIPPEYTKALNTAIEAYIKRKYNIFAGNVYESGELPAWMEKPTEFKESIEDVLETGIITTTEYLTKEECVERYGNKCIEFEHNIARARGDK